MNQRPLRVNSQGAEQYVHQHHPRDEREIGELTKKDKAPKAGHFDGASGLQAAGGTFALQLDELRSAIQNLGRRFDQFTEQMNSSPELAGALPAGTGPVADILAPAFRHRMGSDGGMDWAVRASLEHLSAMLDRLQTTATSYEQVEQDNASAMGDLS